MSNAAVQIVPAEEQSRALANTHGVHRLLRPLASPVDVLAVQEETRKFIEAALVQGRDYGTFPGVDKKSLFKAGAERCCLAFGLVPRYRIVEKEIDHDRPVPWRKVKAKYEGPRGNRTRVGEDITTGESLGLYRYVVECEILGRDSGEGAGSAIASCSTLESKYIDRPRDSENTVLQMAEKRAFVAATRTALGLSEQFTQDIEEDPDRFVKGGGAVDDDAVKCQKCGGAMWDNRSKNDEREKEGKKRMPDYRCKDEKCATVIWDAVKYAAELAQREASAGAAPEGEQPLDPTGTTAQPTAHGSSGPAAHGSPVAGVDTDAPCPVCKGVMWNQSTTKTNVRAPDFVCKNNQCDGKFWPGQWPPKPAATEYQIARLKELAAHDAIPARTKKSVDGLIEKGIKAHKAEEAIARLEGIIAATPAPATSAADEGLPF